MSNLDYLFKAIPWLGFFAAITIAWIFFLKARNKERIALIEKGVDPTQIFTPKKPIKSPWLKFGIIIFGIGIGMASDIFLITTWPQSQMSRTGGITMIITIFLFGGISMIIANFIDRPKQ